MEFGIRRTAAVTNTHQTLVPKALLKTGLQTNQTISPYKIISTIDIQGFPGGKVHILRGHSISHNKQKHVCCV